ncbi:MAG TPA: PilN domain-containing protein [Rhodanobacteraceae bacterium]|nr:PilN domain-containing protein [Rhodanobacteraceae bacterium]
MAKINLLPWRAERRERRKREFFAQLIVAAVAAVVLVALWGFWTSMRIDNQNDRNAYLQGQIQQLDAKITEIKNLQQVKDHLLARKRIVEKLQASRSQMVHLFDQLVDTIPAGARLTGLKQQGDKLTLDGVAQSNATVADFMRNIEASPWMGPAQLVKTEKVDNATNTPYEFELVVTLGVPKSDDNKDTALAESSSSAAPAASAGTVAGASTAGSVAPMTDPPPQAASASAPASGPAGKASGVTGSSAHPATAAPTREAQRASTAATSNGGTRP